MSTTLRETEVYATGEVIFLFMRDQGTHESFGTFAAWLQSEHPTITEFGARRAWAHVLETHGAMTDYDLQALWSRYAEIRKTTDERRGQAFMNALPLPWRDYLTDTWGDCFNNSDAINRALTMLGIDHAGSPIKSGPDVNGLGEESVMKGGR